MADVRALLRQKRGNRRIDHPHAAYSDGGRLLCTLCHESVRSEVLWEAHVRGTSHRQRQQSQKQQRSVSSTAVAAQKRKLGEDESDAPRRLVNGAVREETGEEIARTAKRRRGDMDMDVDLEVEEEEEDKDNGEKRAGDVGLLPGLLPSALFGTKTSQKDDARQARISKQLPVLAATSSERSSASTTPMTAVTGPATPPLSRRMSGTPVHGIEMHIPSRPATPGSGAGSNGVASAVGRSPLVGSAVTAEAKSTTLPTLQRSEKAAQPVPAQPAAPVNEDEWAAFEAELVHGSMSNKIISRSNLPADAVISAPAIPASGAAEPSTNPGSHEKERAAQQARLERRREDDKEEALRALENEFEEMEELEARVARLKARREALRTRGGWCTENGAKNGGVVGEVLATLLPGAGKGRHQDGEEEENSSEEDGDGDDWDGFRFRR